jgi:hypothetical protein
MNDDMEEKVSPRLRGSSEPSRLTPPPPPSRNWSDDIEQVIKEIGESCLGYRWMSILASKQNNFRYELLMYSIIAIGPLAGVFTSVALSYPDENAWLQIISIVLSFISGVVSTSLKFAQLEEKTISFKQVAAKYASLEGNIRRQLNLSRSERVNAGEYLEWVSTSFDELFASTPLMPDSIYNSWVELAKKNNLTIPKELGGFITDNYESKIGPILNRSVSINIEKPKARMSHYNNVPDMNRFADGKMKYELTRLYGWNK